MNALTTRPRPFYGWIVVWAAFAVLAAVFGISYSFAAFFGSFADEFDARRADVSLVFGLSGLVYFALGAAGGAVADRHGPRPVATAGMAIVAAGLFGASFADRLALVYLCYGAGVGLGIALIYTPAMGAVQPWFVRHRGLASGIASAGIGAGTLVVPLAATALIDALDWRAAMRVIAVVLGAVGIAATLCLEKNPARRGLGPDGMPPLPSLGATGHSSLSGATLREAMRSRHFAWLYVAIVMSGPVMFTPFAHVSAHARDLGVPDAQSVSLVGLIGIGSLVGRFAIGALADRLGRLRTLVLMIAAMGASWLLWWAAPGYALLAVFATVFGLCYGGLVSLLPPICMDLFGGRAVSGVIGVLYTGAGFGNLLGPVAAGAVFDATGSYGPVMAAGIACTVAATAAASRVPARPLAQAAAGDR